MRNSIIWILVIYVASVSMSFAGPTIENNKINVSNEKYEVELKRIDTELLTLKVKLEEMRRSEDRLLATVLWSIGGVFTLAIALAAFSWFTSSRLHQREVKLLQQDLSNELEHKVKSVNSEIERIIDSRLTKKEQELAKSSSEHIRKLQADVISVTKLSEAKLRLRIGDINESIYSALESFGAAKHGNTNYIAHAIDVIKEALNSTSASENIVTKEAVTSVRNTLQDYSQRDRDKRAIELREILRKYDVLND